jgi:acetyltransferase
MHERHVTLRDGTRVLIRRLQPADLSLYPDFLSEVTPEDLRLRLLVPTREVNPELLKRLVNYDPATAMAFIAIEEASGRMLGVVRLHDDPDGAMAEFAILVRSRLKGHGLGWVLMRHMMGYAKAKGLKTVYGDVLAENTSMLTMSAELGFHITDDAAERGVRRVELPVDQLPATI